MDFASLKAFVSVAEQGSFSRAAEQLFLTQPAVSKRVAALEDYLGVALFDRLGRGIRLTEAGTRFLTRARRLLADIDISREELHKLNTEVSGRLRLATSHHVGIHRLPPILKAFSQAYPHVELDLLFMDSELACEDVLAGDLELAVVTLPDTVEDGLLTRLVWPDPLSIVCASEHPLVALLKGDKPIRPDLLCQYNAVLPARGTVTRSILFHALQPFNVSVETSLETNYLETIKMMVSVGLGWSALPVDMIDDDLTGIPVAGLDMARRLGSVQLKGRTLSRAAQAFLDLLPENADQTVIRP